MRKVFHLITTISRGGAENQLLVLANEQIKQGLDVHVVYLKGEPELKTDFERGGAVVNSELAGYSPLMQTFKFRKLIGNLDPIVHAHLPRAELVAFFTLTKFKFISSRHNAEPFFPSAPRFLSNFLARIVEIRNQRIIAISNAVKNNLIQTGESANAEKIEVVLYGYKSKQNRSLKNISNSRASFKIGTISRLTEQKDIPTMLRTFQNIRKYSPNSSLAILGAGPLEQELKEMVRKMELVDAVEFLGRSEHIYEFLNQLDVFILTSKYEGFGMVLLEAMDSGAPIVAANNSAIPEVLGESFPGLCETGNIEDFTKKVLNLRNIETRKEILSIQEERLKLFSSAKMAKSIERIYFE